MDNFRRVLLIPQLLCVNRLKRCPLKYAYGSTWCSITHDALCEIVEMYDNVRPYFFRTTCSDEHYKQMILLSSKKDFVFAKEGSLRFIVFSKGASSPRILSMNDYSKIVSSNCLFGRKIEENTEVYDKVYLRASSHMLAP